VATEPLDLGLLFGRRSRAQLERLEWSGDPTAVLDQLCILGPSPLDIVE
jgi:hypothetical protein